MIEHAYKRTSGFTLMEIMVVIIVIAVLASVAGPMISEITDSGRASATRSQMSSLRAALITYAQDTGSMPYSGDKDQLAAYQTACDQLLFPGFAKAAEFSEGNVLVNFQAGLSIVDSHPARSAGSKETVPPYAYAAGDSGEASKYSKRWKGPYMDGEAGDFMFEPWQSKILYRAYERSLFLISAGPDGLFDTSKLGDTGDEDPLDDAYEGDDIMTSIHRVRRSFDATGYTLTTAYDEN